MEIYHTETQEDFDSLMIELEKKGAKWFSGNQPTTSKLWNTYKEHTCIRLEENIIMCAEISYYKEAYTEVPIKKYKAPSTKIEDFISGLQKSGILARTRVSDPVNSPKHYNTLKTEVIDTIEEVTEFYPKKIRYHIGNVIKYLFRAPFKNNIKEDLKKAQWYLQRAIDKLEDNS